MLVNRDISFLIKTILIIVYMVVLSSCSFEEDMTLVYDESAIIERRKELDDFFKNDASSPLKEHQKYQFEGLQYFPATEDFAFYAQFKVNTHPDTVQLLTSKGYEKRTMLRYGSFSIQDQDGTTFTLTGYRSLDAEDDMIFIPFKDKTNGVETYESGRYLEVEHLPDNSEYFLDFNKAYNPYCAYNKDYACPLVPKENFLSISIKAGEKRPIFQ